MLHKNIKNIYRIVSLERKSKPEKQDDYSKMETKRYERQPPSHDELLLELKGAPKMIPVKERGDEGFDNLPDSELLEAIHYFFARNFDSLRSNSVYQRQMDESALLAMGVLVEHIVEDFISEEGHLPYSVDQNERKIKLFTNRHIARHERFQKRRLLEQLMNDSKIKKIRKYSKEDRRRRMERYKLESENMAREFAEIEKGANADSDSSDMNDNEIDDGEEDEESEYDQEEEGENNTNANKSIDDFYDAVEELSSSD